MAGAIKPITGMLKKGLVTDLAIALATMMRKLLQERAQLTGNRHGYHMPRTIARDNFYAALEKERAAKQGQ
ncbi:hypothetical protein LQW54_004606 [Pestalotiopsis sp. IQ-011]